MNGSLTELSKIIKKSVFIPKLKAETKEGVLIEITDTLVREKVVAKESRNAVLAALVERESKMSTGMQYGVAIPHAKTNLVSQLTTFFALSQKGVDFCSLDGTVSTVFVGTLSPLSAVNLHIKFLAEVSKQLSSRKVREKVLKAQNIDDLVETICGTSE